MRSQHDEGNGVSHPSLEQLLKIGLLLALATASVSLHAQFNEGLCSGRQIESQSGHSCNCARFIRCRFDDQPAASSAATNEARASRSGALSSNVLARALPRRPDFNRDVYYKNKLEFSLQTGWLPINIPFVFDFLLGGGYNMTPLKYTLVPVIASLHWQTGDVRGPGFLRGNWDLNTSASFTAIPRGPETRYISYMMGIRRNFVQRNWRVSPYFEGRVGVGNIDAKEPAGVEWAQGQDLTFNLILHSGVQYNVNSRYGISCGVAYMHISNLYLSEPRYPNYGINVYGPMMGLSVALGRHQPRSTR
jgi:hypothetical protein